MKNNQFEKRMLKIFEELGATVTKNWAQKNFDDHSFPDIASDSMLRSNILNSLEPEDIIDWFVSSAAIPEQKYRNFGQPPINVYSNERFFIEVLFWYDSTTTIHQHAFSGAFGVLAGSSLHTSYKFELEEVISSNLKFGKVKFSSSDLLSQGDIKPICIGNQFIHSLFHLERPSLSLVIRTRSKAEYKPQYIYLKPSLAINPENNEEPYITQLNLLDGLSRTRPDIFWKSAKSIVKSKNLLALYRVFLLSCKLIHEKKEWDDLISVAKGYYNSKHLDYVLSCVLEQFHQVKLIEKRKMIHDPEYRFFLALLLNIPNREHIFDLVSKKYPNEDSIEIILKWVKQLFDYKLIDFKCEGTLLDLLTSVLSGVSFEKTKALIINKQSHLSHPISETELVKMWSKISNCKMLQPLL